MSDEWPDSATAAGNPVNPLDASFSAGSAEEAERARLLFELEQHEAAQPRDSGRDPIHVVRIRLDGMPPGMFVYGLARWTLIARYRRDSAGSADEITDLGPGALRLAEAAQGADFGRAELGIVGIALGGEWLSWLSPFPVEPVPGTESTGGFNAR